VIGTDRKATRRVDMEEVVRLALDGDLVTHSLSLRQHDISR
jgi:hypothetical protein